MPEIILIALAKNLFHILKNEVGNQKRSKRGGGVHPPINPSPIKRAKKEQKIGPIKGVRQKIANYEGK